MIFDHLISEALSDSGNNNRNSVYSDSSDIFSSISDSSPNILVIGVGSTGCSVIRRLHNISQYTIRTIAIDRDQEELEKSSSPVTFLLNSSYFPPGSFGFCGGDPDLVDRVSGAMKQALPDLIPYIGAPDLCIIVAGMGGNTGTGVANVVASMLKERGVIVVAFVVLPAAIEERRRVRAVKGLNQIIQFANSVIVLNLNEVKAIAPKNLPYLNFFRIMDHIIALSIRNVFEMILLPDNPSSLISFDYEDIKHIFENGGFGTVFLGEIHDKKKITTRESENLVFPLSHNYSEDIKGAIIHITAGNDTCIYENDLLINEIIRDFNVHADIVRGITVKTDFEGRKRILAVVTTRIINDFNQERWNWI